MSTKLLSNRSSRSCALINFFNFCISHVGIMSEFGHKNDWKKSRTRLSFPNKKNPAISVATTIVIPNKTTWKHNTDLRNWIVHYLWVHFFEFFITIETEFIYITRRVKLNKKRKPLAQNAKFILHEKRNVISFFSTYKCGQKCQLTVECGIDIEGVSFARRQEMKIECSGKSNMKQKPIGSKLDI